MSTPIFDSIHYDDHDYNDHDSHVVWCLVLDSLPFVSVDTIPSHSY